MTKFWFPLSWVLCKSVKIFVQYLQTEEGIVSCTIVAKAIFSSSKTNIKRVFYTQDGIDSVIQFELEQKKIH